MANKYLVQAMDDTPPQILLRDSTDYAPAAANVLTTGTPTAVQINLEGLTVNEARQSDKFDLGENRAPAYAVRASFEFAATPTAGVIIRVYAAPSQSATAANGNGGNVSGSDSDYTGYSSNIEASVKQLDLIGAFTLTAQATGTIQKGEVQGMFYPKERYCTLVVVMPAAGATFHSDAVETSMVLDPQIPELQ